MLGVVVGIVSDGGDVGGCGECGVEGVVDVLDVGVGVCVVGMVEVEEEYLVR